LNSAVEWDKFFSRLSFRWSNISFTLLMGTKISILWF